MKKSLFLMMFLLTVYFSHGICGKVLLNSIPAIDDSLSQNLKKAKELVNKGKKEEASKILTQIMGTHPHNKEAVQWWLIANMKRSPTGERDAIPMLDTLSTKYPENTGILFYKTFIQAEYGMNQEALINIEKLIKIEPDTADNWILKGQILHGLEKYQDACKAFDRSLKLNPSRTDVWGMKASSLSKIGQFDEAIAIMNQRIEVGPEVAENFYNRACLYCLKGDKSNALIDLKKAFIMNPELKEWAKQDADLNNLHENEDFKKLTK